MTNLEKLESALAEWHARLDAHNEHGAQVSEMFKARAKANKKQVSLEVYEAEWKRYNDEENSLKRFPTSTFQNLAKLAGVELKTLTGWRFEILKPAPTNS